MTRAEELARKMHDAYEAAAPKHGWVTQERSRKPWEEVPEGNRALMIEVMEQVFVPMLVAERKAGFAAAIDLTRSHLRILSMNLDDAAAVNNEKGT
jgi:hypothetical protein